MAKTGKRALITGITGQDGSYLAELLGELQNRELAFQVARLLGEHAREPEADSEDHLPHAEERGLPRGEGQSLGCEGHAHGLCQHVVLGFVER